MAYTHRQQREAFHLSLDYAHYQGPVLDYLEADARVRFTGAHVWGDISEAVLRLIEGP